MKIPTHNVCFCTFLFMSHECESARSKSIRSKQVAPLVSYLIIVLDYAGDR